MNKKPFHLKQEDNLRKRIAAGFAAIVNFILAVVVLTLGKNLLAIVLAIYLIVVAVVAARKWIQLSRPQS
ncbi:MAG: hypothetical protein CVU39_14080 [Chloroflexi bacterium HGW-Chloroflexi-10]|nr:MAG: hypothetical protein CVU39_14080 [Chloroflexi bacterium HGW-Chloroflexi-10]